MKLISKLPAWLRNKYFIAIAAFCVIMLFLDKNDIFTQFGRKKELHNLQTSKNYYIRQNEALRKESEALKHDPQSIEKLAREKYLMKKDNEELFLISEKPDNSKN
ncbi:MAG TPA: septum formation initiator family protein [Chitinophagaceae bacterium]|nr:septum formation initiator family protein [Chitinophagaceae bacterium]